MGSNRLLLFRDSPNNFEGWTEWRRSALKKNSGTILSGLTVLAEHTSRRSSEWSLQHSSVNASRNLFHGALWFRAEERSPKTFELHTICVWNQISFFPLRNLRVITENPRQTFPVWRTWEKRAKSASSRSYVIRKNSWRTVNPSFGE